MSKCDKCGEELGEDVKESIRQEGVCVLCASDDYLE
jgi:formylmethanofuran dehydrogenase subunit E